MVPQAPLHERSVRYVKGIGPQRMSRLAELGIRTVEDACWYAPRRYEDRRQLVAIRDVAPGGEVTVRGRVLAAGLRRARGGRTIFEAALGDATGVLQALWFNQPYLARHVARDQELILYGRVEAGPRSRMIHPEVERCEAGDDAAIHMGRIVPVYPLTAGISQRWLRSRLWSIIEQHAGEVEETLPEAIRAPRGWPPLAEAIRAIHFPESWEALAAARERLVFEELLLVQLILAKRRAALEARRKPQRYRLDGPLTGALRHGLPFALTGAQERVLEELLGDLALPHPMARLLQGDVGCGKTIVVIFLMAVVAQSGGQVALMAPTELLAEQHARVLRQFLGPLGVDVRLLSQSVPKPARDQAASDAAEGRAAVVVGTHALLEGHVRFARLWLAVIDEQHKFGVAQRAGLARKGQEPDILVMTATPIPRTLALSLYGDLDVSTIDDMPPGRAPLDTRWMREAERSTLYALIRGELARGRQAYVVYPLVDVRGGSELKSATRMAQHLKRDVFPEFAVGLLHGQMRPQLKERTMLDFARGEIQLLVTTVIVEVGLDVTNATLMVIEHPERFGLAQLHQLRGRIGRGADPSTCVVVSDAEDEAVRARLEAFAGTRDGFLLAEEDLRQRGPGELFGSRQHGWLRLRIADLARDRDRLEGARTEARRLIAQDPALSSPDLAPLAGRLGRFQREGR
ncbi:MAG TPA: ATP-dependent DNA helicase RecG [bacterium]